MSSKGRASAVLGFWAALLATSTSFGGPWSPAKGTSYQQASVNAVALNDRAEYAASYYGEFGFGGGWAFVASVPLRFADATSDRPSGLPGEDFFALTPTAGVRYQLLRGPVVFALQSDLGIPFAGGATDLTNQALAGASLAGGRAFVQTGGGIRLRTENAGHEAIWSADAGLWITPSVLGMASGRGRYQLDRDPRAQRAEVENRVGTQWLYRIDQSIDIGVEVLYTIPEATVSEGLSATAYVAFWLGP